MGNILLVKIKKSGVTNSIDAISTEKSEQGCLIHHHRLDLGNFSWYMNSGEMLDELRDVVCDAVDDLNNVTKADATTGLNILQFELFNSIIKRIKRLYKEKSVSKVSYLVQSDDILKDGSIPGMEWNVVPKK